MKKGIYTLGALVALSLAGCKTDEDFDGPSLNDLYGSFAVVQGLEASSESVDFESGDNVYFTAQFSKNIDWTLRIEGLQSGAVKEMTGFSNLLDASNATWTGTTTILPMFKQEACAVQLTFLNETDTLRDTLSIASTRVNSGFLLTDFESGGNSGWTTFVQTGANMSFAIQNGNDAAQGNNFFNIGGVVNWDWLIGLIDMPGSAYGDVHFPLSSNPENEYFNTMIYKQADLENGIMLFQFREDDNGDGVYTSGQEDMYSWEVHMTGSGWKLYSMAYADLPTLINGAPAAAIGNGLHEPDKLIQVSTLFLANPSSGYANSYLDYMIFTQGGPLEP